MVAETNAGWGAFAKGICFNVKHMISHRSLARILHQAAYRVHELCWFLLDCIHVFEGCIRYKTRWPRPRLSFALLRAHAPSTIGGAMLAVASTRRRAKSGAIIAAPGAICGLVEFKHGTTLCLLFSGMRRIERSSLSNEWEEMKYDW